MPWWRRRPQSCSLHGKRGVFAAQDSTNFVANALECRGIDTWDIVLVLAASSISVLIVPSNEQGQPICGGMASYRWDTIQMVATRSYIASLCFISSPN